TLPASERDDPHNVSVFPWDRLQETFRRDKRDVVDHIPAKLSSGGVSPAAWRGVKGLPKLPPGVHLYNCDEELERLAELEHERWNAQRRMDGWRHTTGKKSEPLRLHPSLVLYEALDYDVQGYDRAYIRQTQAICETK